MASANSPELTHSSCVDVDGNIQDAATAILDDFLKLSAHTNNGIAISAFERARDTLSGLPGCAEKVAAQEKLWIAAIYADITEPGERDAPEAIRTASSTKASALSTTGRCVSRLLAIVQHWPSDFYYCIRVSKINFPPSPGLVFLEQLAKLASRQSMPDFLARFPPFLASRLPTLRYDTTNLERQAEGNRLVGPSDLKAYIAAIAGSTIEAVHEPALHRSRRKSTRSPPPIELARRASIVDLSQLDPSALSVSGLESPFSVRSAKSAEPPSESSLSGESLSEHIFAVSEDGDNDDSQGDHGELEVEDDISDEDDNGEDGGGDGDDDDDTDTDADDGNDDLDIVGEAAEARAPAEAAKPAKVAEPPAGAPSSPDILAGAFSPARARNPPSAAPLPKSPSRKRRLADFTSPTPVKLKQRRRNPPLDAITTACNMAHSPSTSTSKDSTYGTDAARSPAAALAPAPVLALPPTSTAHIPSDLEPAKWLTSKTMHDILSMLVPGRETHAWFDPGNVNANAPVAALSRLRFTNIDNVFVVLCMSQHWLFVRYDLRHVKIHLHDSMRNHVSGHALLDTITHIGRSIWAAAGNNGPPFWEIVAVTVPQQQNTYDCGVLAIVSALRVTAGLSTTEGVESSVWRLLLHGLHTGQAPAADAMVQYLEALCTPQGDHIAPIRHELATAHTLVTNLLDKSTRCEARYRDRLSRQEKEVASLLASATSERDRMLQQGAYAAVDPAALRQVHAAEDAFRRREYEGPLRQTQRTHKEIEASIQHLDRLIDIIVAFEERLDIYEEDLVQQREDEQDEARLRHLQERRAAIERERAEYDKEIEDTNQRRQARAMRLRRSVVVHPPA